MRRPVPWIAPIVLVGVALVLLAWPAPPAWAHVTLVSSDPEAGERLVSMPPGVTLKFSGELEPVAEVLVTGPDGSALSAGTTIVSADTLIQRVSDQGGPGAYVVEYTATSLDGHDLTGRLDFTVGGAVAAAPDGADDTEASSDEGGGSTTIAWAISIPATILAAALLFWVVTHRPGRTPAPGGPATTKAKAATQAKTTAKGDPSKATTKSGTSKSGTSKGGTTKGTTKATTKATSKGKNT